MSNWLLMFAYAVMAMAPCHLPGLRIIARNSALRTAESRMRIEQLRDVLKVVGIPVLASRGTALRLRCFHPEALAKTSRGLSAGLYLFGFSDTVFSGIRSIEGRVLWSVDD